jgi:hypothetical protein
MEKIEAKILFKNLLKRIRKIEGEHYELSGSLTDDEFKALTFALNYLDGASSTSIINKESPHELTPMPEALIHSEIIEIEKPPTPSITLDTSVLDLPTAENNIRLCLDFGTAMSKASLVTDSDDVEYIEVLKLGIPTDQENISPNMLTSSVYIDTDGLVWFGQRAIERSNSESYAEPRQRLDNIKRYLSEEGFDTKVSGQFNPTNIPIKFGDMIQAYLMYLTWAVNNSPETASHPKNIERRFAMPCFENAKARDFSQRLRDMLGKSQILADTFSLQLAEGAVPLSELVIAMNKIKNKSMTFNFISQDISEPLGVAGSLINWHQPRKDLIMVVDVGAGTSDFSLFSIKIDPAQKINSAIQVANSSKGITEAGNHLDELLEHYILQKSPITYEHEHWLNVIGALKLRMREYKETLFSEEELHASLFTGDVVEVSLEEFLLLDGVKSFAKSLKNCMSSILNQIDDSFIRGAPNRRLILAFSGGGAELPMVKALADEDLIINGTRLATVRAIQFPKWLKDEGYEDLEEDYPRIAVSLGGARSKIIECNSIATVTAGDVEQAPILERFQAQGI